LPSAFEVGVGEAEHGAERLAGQIGDAARPFGAAVGDHHLDVRQERLAPAEAALDPAGDVGAQDIGVARLEGADDAHARQHQEARLASHRLGQRQADIAVHAVDQAIMLDARHRHFGGGIDQDHQLAGLRQQRDQQRTAERESTAGKHGIFGLCGKLNNTTRGQAGTPSRRCCSPGA
jgi:hypothetical protein